MKRGNWTLGATVFGLAALTSAPAMAHEGHVHKAMGTVASIDATHIEVKESATKSESITLTSATKFKKGSTAVASTDVTPNSKVVVKYMESKGEKNATEVDLSSGSSSSKKKGSTTTTTSHAQ